MSACLADRAANSILNRLHLSSGEDIVGDRLQACTVSTFCLCVHPNFIELIEVRFGLGDVIVLVSFRALHITGVKAAESYHGDM